MNGRKSLIATAASGLLLSGLVTAVPAAADPGFSVSPASVAFPDPAASGDAFAILRVTPDPGYLVSAADSYRAGPSGSYRNVQGTAACSEAGQWCYLWFYAASLAEGEDPAWTEQIAECVSPGVGCRWLAVPVTVGPAASVFTASFPPSVDFEPVQVGTTATRDMALTLDPGYSVRQAATPLPPFGFSFASCDNGATGSCAVQNSFTPTALGSASGSIAVTECTADWICVENNADPVPLSGTGVPAGTTTTVTSSANPVTFAHPVTFVASVTTVSTIAPTGSVTFYDNGTRLGSASVGTGRSASITVSDLEPGTNSIRATYSGDELHAGSTSAPLTESVTFDRCTNGGGGTLTVHAGQAVCVRGTWVGTISVQPGGAVALLDAQVSGAVTSSGAAAVTVCGSSVAVALTVSGSPGPVVVGAGPADAVVCARNTFAGSVAVRSNTGGVELAGNLVAGSLACSGNSSAPVDGGRANTVIGIRSGQCAAGTF